VVELVVQLEVRAVNSELVVSVQLRGECVGGRPDVGAGGDEGVHAVIDGGTVEGAVHAGLRWWVVAVRVGGEDDIPQSVDEMDLWSPDIGAVGLAGGRKPELFRVSVVPVGEYGASKEGYIGTGRVGHVVVAVPRLDHPGVSAGAQDRVGVGCAACTGSRAAV